MSSATPTTIVSIGQGRRLTLAELDGLVRGHAKLQWHTEETSGETAAEPPIAATTTTESASPESLATWVILAFQLAQIHGNASPMARSLVQAIHVRQEWSAADWQSLNSATDDTDAVPAALLERCRRLAVVSLASVRATQVATCALPVAAVTVDATGGVAAVTTTEAVSELALDTLRPHRSMMAAAAIVRAIWHESKFQGTSKEESATLASLTLDNNNKQNDTANALRNIPQYHGPAMEALTTAMQRLELETNARALTPDQPLDPTLVESACATIRLHVTTLLQASRDRQGLDNANNDKTLDILALVHLWRDTLQTEARISVATIHAHDAAAAEAQRVKDANKAAAANQHQRPANSATTDDLAGMTDAQKAKVLKKRSEKEAKAAAKLQAKQAKGTTLFGAGTATLMKIFEETHYAFDTAHCATLVSAATTTLLSGGVQRKPKIAKGTRDYLPDQMMIRQQAFAIIRRVFESHGAVEIDTPVFELRDTLTGKYGEDSKLIYDLADQGGELLALRYDLTVPLARFLALNSVGNLKRFHIGKVYRRDQPALKRGRYREFYQCDFDIAGVYGRMVPDSECLCVVCDILDALPIGDFAIKLNHRCLLDAILDLCGVPADKFRTICSAVDKLDKEPWSEVKREMVSDKGLEEHVADKIGEFVLNKGPPFQMYKELMDAKRFGNHKGALQAMEDLRILFEYLEAFDKLKFISFDLSLARGLDYYTGVIYEAVCVSGNTQVGSIGGGGRYDNLVSMFQEAGKQTPCVGVSVGIERVFTLMEERLRQEKGGSIKQPNVSVLVASAGGAMMKEKMKIARLLWDSNISAEFSQQENAKLKKEVVTALDREIPFMVVIGEDEIKDSKCQVKDIKANTADLVPIAELVATLREKGVIPVGCEFAAEMLKQDKQTQ